MKREKILEIFVKNNLMLEPDALEFFIQNPDQIDIFLDRVRKAKEQPLIITTGFVKSILKEKAFEIEEIKKKTIDKKTISVGDISNVLVERYEKIKSFFSYRLDIINLISINKINEKTKKFSLIVMVREVDKKNKTILVEDLTGEILVHIPTTAINYLIRDEVVGLFCEKFNGEISATNIFFPDIPLKKTIGKLEEDVYCLFISKVVFEEKSEEILKEINKMKFEFLYVFLFLDKVLDKEKIENFRKKLPLNSKLVLITEIKNELEGILAFNSPVFLTLGKKIILLLIDGRMFSAYENLGKDPVEIMLNLLKKRHLNPEFGIEKLSLENLFLIDPIPDIFVSGNFSFSGFINYKGTTIISCGSSEKIFWIVNLKTRETLRINLD